MVLFTFITFVLSALSVVNATPIPPLSIARSELGIQAGGLARRQSITTLSTAQISAFKPFTFFASAAYCQPSTTINWSCGGESKSSYH